MAKIDPKMSVAPMMNWTDRHCRVFHRLLSKYTVLYTEMITSGAVMHGDRNHLLKFSELEHPVALQLGGSNPVELAEASEIGVDFGYDEINFNLGCPSDRVQSGCFGAVLMKQPRLAFKCVSAIKTKAKDKKVTAKCRLGVDDQEPEFVLPTFIKGLVDSGVDGVIIHARKAMLNGLTPKQNRTIPELNYDLVCQMKTEFPQVEFVINGGIDSLEHVNELLKTGLNGVMIGRAAYYNPHNILLLADDLVFRKKKSRKNMKMVLSDFCNYIELELGHGTKLNEMTRHILGAFNGFSGARNFRRLLSENAWKSNAGLEIVKRAIDMVTEEEVITSQKDIRK